MNSKRVFFVMIGALVLSFGLLIGGVVLGNGLLKKQSAKLLSLKLENHVLDEQQKSLVQANKDIQKYAELEKIANAIVPQDKDQAKTVREIIKLAESSNVPISNITFPTSTLGQAAPKPVTGATGTATPTAPAVVATPPITQVKPAEGLKGVYQMEVTVISDPGSAVPYSSLIDFLSKLEHNRRTAQVSNIDIRPDSKKKGMLTFTIQINLFIKP